MIWVVVLVITVLGGAAQRRPATMTRLKSMSASVGVFAAGCACAALVYARLNVWCFAAPPLLAAIGVALARPKAGSQ
ncbi:MAG: hypothetical protein JWQ97_2041 [Phenylobacterium sp.]|nr:hypothetical protein [Phenylobacterium sp.]